MTLHLLKNSLSKLRIRKLVFDIFIYVLEDLFLQRNRGDVKFFEVGPSLLDLKLRYGQSFGFWRGGMGIFMGKRLSGYIFVWLKSRLVSLWQVKDGVLGERTSRLRGQRSDEVFCLLSEMLILKVQYLRDVNPLFLRGAVLVESEINREIFKSLPEVNVIIPQDFQRWNDLIGLIVTQNLNFFLMFTLFSYRGCFLDFLFI